MTGEGNEGGRDDELGKGERGIKRRKRTAGDEVTAGGAWKVGRRAGWVDVFLMCPLNNREQ